MGTEKKSHQQKFDESSAAEKEVRGNWARREVKPSGPGPRVFDRRNRRWEGPMGWWWFFRFEKEAPREKDRNVYIYIRCFFWIEVMNNVYLLRIVVRHSVYSMYI